MCRKEDSCNDSDYGKSEIEMKILAKVEKSKILTDSKSRMKLWMFRALMTALFWTCVVHLMTLGELGRPRLLKGWPSCFSHRHFHLAVELSSLPHKIIYPPKSEF